MEEISFRYSLLENVYLFIYPTVFYKLAVAFPVVECDKMTY